MAKYMLVNFKTCPWVRPTNLQRFPLMKLLSRIVAPVCAIAFAAGVAPAFAQNPEFTSATVIKQGTTTHDITGKGTVVVKVLVNADGTQKDVIVVHSTNPGDDAAALEIAENSTYSPAHLGSTPIKSFYIYQIKFNDHSVDSAAPSH